MTRTIAAMLAALFLLAPLAALADDGDFYPVPGDVAFGNADDYRWKASTLEGQRQKLAYRQQWIVSDLIDVYYKMAETQAAITDAGDIGDRNRQELLERQFRALTAEEVRLWREFERLNK